jgi:hypothetical protein
MASSRGGAAAEPSSRLLIRDATLLAVESDGSESARPHVTIVIERGVITAIVPASEIALLEGDVPVDARGAYVLPGLIEITGDRTLTCALAVRRTFRGVTTLVAPLSEIERSWMQRVAHDTAFRLPDLLAAPPQAAASVPLPQTGPDPADSRRSRIRWLFERTAGDAARAGLHDRGRLAVGQRGDCVLLRGDPREDLAVVERPEQVVLNGRPLRIAELEVGRSMVERADAAVASFRREAADVSSASAFLIESGGLRVGHLTLGADARSGDERWAPPVNQRTTWTRTGGSSDWSLELRQQINGADVEAHVRRVDATLRARIRVRPIEKPAGPVTAAPADPPWVEDTIPVPADGPVLDPMSALGSERTRLAALALGAALTLDLAELNVGPEAVQVGVRTLRLVRVAAADCPMPVGRGEFVLRLETASGHELGWAELTTAGEPLRAALFAPEGITEYLPEDPQPRPTRPAINEGR